MNINDMIRWSFTTEIAYHSFNRYDVLHTLRLGIASYIHLFKKGGIINNSYRISFLFVLRRDI